MQSLPSKRNRPFVDAGFSVYFISQKGMPDMRHMDSDLVCPSRFQLALHIGIFTELLQNSVMSDRFLAAGFDNGHFLSVVRMSSDQRMNTALLLRQRPAHNGPVFADNAVFLELSGYGGMGDIVFAGNDRARGVLVDSMYNPRP